VSAAMEQYNSAADDLVYTIVGELFSRLTDKVERKELKEIMATFVDDYKLASIPIRRRPKPKSKTASTSKDPNLSDVIRETRAKKNKKLVWNKCNTIKDVPRRIRNMVFCNDEALGLDENCALLGKYDEEEDETIIYAIVNDNFEFRYISERESKYFDRFNLKIEEDSIRKDKKDLEFSSV